MHYALLGQNGRHVSHSVATLKMTGQLKLIASSDKVKNV